MRKKEEQGQENRGEEKKAGGEYKNILHPLYVTSTRGSLRKYSLRENWLHHSEVV
jgi:hypothetical protein